MEDVVNWAQIVGAVLALVAVILASYQVKRSEDFQTQARQDLRDDRRIDFQLGLLADVAVAWEAMDVLKEAGAAESEAAAKLLILPHKYVPTLRAYLKLPLPEDLDEETKDRANRCLQAADRAERQEQTADRAREREASRQMFPVPVMPTSLSHSPHAHFVRAARGIVRKEIGSAIAELLEERQRLDRS